MLEYGSAVKRTHNEENISTTFIYLFIYNQIPPQSEENIILHKRTEIKN